MSSDGKEPLSIISASGDKKLSDTKLTTIDLKAKEAEANGDVLYVNWRNEFPIKVKKILFTMKENSAKLVLLEAFSFHRNFRLFTCTKKLLPELLSKDDDIIV